MCPLPPVSVPVSLSPILSARALDAPHAHRFICPLTYTREGAPVLARVVGEADDEAAAAEERSQLGHLTSFALAPHSSAEAEDLIAGAGDNDSIHSASPQPRSPLHRSSFSTSTFPEHILIRLPASELAVEPHFHTLDYPMHTHSPFLGTARSSFSGGRPRATSRPRAASSSVVGLGEYDSARGTSSPLARTAAGAPVVADMHSGRDNVFLSSFGTDADLSMDAALSAAGSSEFVLDTVTEDVVATPLTVSLLHVAATLEQINLLHVLAAVATTASTPAPITANNLTTTSSSTSRALGREAAAAGNSDGTSKTSPLDVARSDRKRSLDEAKQDRRGDHA